MKNQDLYLKWYKQFRILLHKPINEITDMKVLRKPPFLDFVIITADDGYIMYFHDKKLNKDIPPISFFIKLQKYAMILQSVMLKNKVIDLFKNGKVNEPYYSRYINIFNDMVNFLIDAEYYKGIKSKSK